MLNLSRLSPEQCRVVVAPEGPLAITAGPGSGKTTVLAARIAYLVTVRQYSPATILALTFTTAAVRTLRTRLGTVLDAQATLVDVLTFHAFGLRIIRQWSEQIGLGSGPIAVCHGSDTRSLLQEAAARVGLDLGQYRVAELVTLIERYRLGDRRPGTSEQIRTLANAYEGLLRRRCLVDYPAMLALPLRLFRIHPLALQGIQDAYRAILCDEAQDVNTSQYALLRILADRHHHLVLVGDPRQTLYGWRGANSRFLREFALDFPEAQVLRLDHNFRSTHSIVDVANALGRNLGESQPLWTDNPPGEVPALHVARDEQDEANFVAKEITSLLASGEIDHPGDVAVLYRTNRQAGNLELALTAHQIPYRVRGRGDLFTRREVRDAIAYLRLVHDPTDAVALTRIVNVPPRGLGRIVQILRQRPITLHELPIESASLGRVAATAAEALVDLVDDLHAQRTRYAAGALLDLVLERSGYSSWLAGQADRSDRLASLAALGRLIDEITAADASVDLGTLLTDVELGNLEETDSADRGRVLLTTIHQAKGDEARVVFVVGLEEGLIPHARAVESEEDAHSAVDAERRVAYVAVTRARERLYLTYCRTRRRDGWIERRHPCRFLRGLPLVTIERAA